MTSSIEIYCDGSGRNAQGEGAAAIVVIKDGMIIHQAGFPLGEVTNNVAEYVAVIKALEYATSREYFKVSLFSDSELIVKQINCQYQVKDENLKKYWNEVFRYHSTINFTITWLPRTHLMISRADKLMRSIR